MAMTSVILRLLVAAFAVVAAAADGTSTPSESCSSGACAYKGSALLQSKRARTMAPLAPEAEDEEEEEEGEDEPMPEDVSVSPELVRKIREERNRKPPVLADTSQEEVAWIDMTSFDSSASVEKQKAKQAYDGDSTTHGGAVDMLIDMGEVYEFAQTKVEFRACKCSKAGSVLIAVSIDKKNWYTFFTPTLNVWGGRVLRDKNHHVLRGRYLKIQPTAKAGTRWVSIWEVSIKGKKDPESHPNVYGWWKSYKAGVNGLSGTEMVHLYGYKGKLFGGTGYWMHTGDWRAAEVVRLDCPYCDWVVEAEVFPYAGRTEILKAIEWTTNKNGQKLAKPVPKLISGFYVDWEGEGRCYAAVRDDATTEWPLELYWRGPFKKNYYSARALQLYQDTVTGVDILFFNSGMDGIIPGTYDPTKDTKVTFATKSETGEPEECRPLALTVMDHRLYFSASSKIKRRINGNNPSWELVWDHLDHDDAGTVDEAVGGIRGITGITNPSSAAGESLLFSWAPNGRSKACMVRLDPNGDTYDFTEEKCVKDMAIQYLGDNTDHLAAKVTYSLADYNFALELPDDDGGTAHIIGYQILLFAYTAVDFPTDPGQTRTSSSGKLIGYYAGAGYMIRRGALNYEVREPGGKRYDPSAVFPRNVAVRSLAASPWPGDRSVYMGGYDCNFFPSLNTAWVMSANFDAVFKKPSPCQKELGCGHTPGEPFKVLGCDWCGFREFAGSKLIGFVNGRAQTCQDVVDFLNSAEGVAHCASAQTWPSEKVCCLGTRCNICAGTKKTFVPTNIAGKNSQGKNYNCKFAQDSVDSGSFTCKQGKKWWRKSCCR